MTEFHIIGLGNLCEFVIKDIDNSRTHGVFSACGKHARESMQGFIDYVNEIIEENQALKQSDNITDLETQIMKLKEENKELRSDREYWKTLAQSLARTNGNVKDEHLAWKRVDVE